MRILILSIFLFINCGDDEVDQIPDASMVIDASVAVTPDAESIVPIDASPDTGCSSVTVMEAQNLWMETAKLLCKVVNDCGVQPFEDCIRDFEDDTAFIVSVRCKEELINECWTWIRTSPCESLVFGQVDDSCRGAFRTTNARKINYSISSKY